MISEQSSIVENAVRQYTKALLSAAWGLGWRGTEAEDLVQDTLVTFLNIHERFEGRSSLKTFLFGILYKKALERRRETSREFATDPIDDVFEGRFGFGGIWKTFPRGPEEHYYSQETLQLIEGCLNGLPTQQRMAFYLREVEGATTDEICKILELTVTHLGVLLFRARNKLRECVQKKWEGQKRA